MNKYYDIKVYEFNLSDIFNSEFIYRRYDQESYIIAKKVSNGFKEIKTGFFIPDKEVFVRNYKNTSPWNFCVNAEITDEIKRKGSIIVADTKINDAYIRKIENIDEIKEYFEEYDKSKFKTILEASLKRREEFEINKRNKKREERINKYNNIKNNIKKFIENEQKENKRNKEIKKYIKEYSKGE